MIRKIIALCLVIMAVSAAFTGCKDKEPEKPDGDDVKNVVDDAGDAVKDAVDEHAGHDHE